MRLPTTRELADSIRAGLLEDQKRRLRGIALDDYLAIIEEERDRRPAEARLLDEILRLRRIVDGGS